jgi:hydrogenase maturation protease
MYDKNILVIGLGNPILGDDGVGWRIVEKVRSEIKSTSSKWNQNPRIVDFDTLSLGGIGLMEVMIDYNFAIIVDAMRTHTKSIGEVTTFTLDDFPTSIKSHTGSSHDMSLDTAISMGRRMGFKIPKKIFIVGVEADSDYVFSEELTPQVEKAIPEATKAVIEIVKELENDL